MREIVKKLVHKHWRSNWNESMCEEDMVDWVMKFAQDIVYEWLKKFADELENSDE